jgi:hypothetical protein
MTGEPTQVLRPSPLRCLGLSAACAVMAGMLIYLWIEGTGDAWIPALFMILGAIFFAFHLVPNAYALWPDDQGFNVSEMFTVKRYEWSAVSVFNVRRGILGYYVEFYHDMPGEERPKRIVLNETYGFKPVDMARLLNNCRNRSLEAKPAAKKTWPSQNS